MSRDTLEPRRIAHEHWPLLSNLLASYFGQDSDAIDGSLWQAIGKATRDGSLDHRRAVIAEWLEWNSSEGSTDDIRPFLADGFGVEVVFETKLKARNFMNRLYDDLKSGLREQTSGG